jgi:tetratricopeptide (TPR) repeat protein
MPATSKLLAELFDQAQKHHRARRFADAQQLYSRITGADEAHLDAWHHLGLVYLAQNRLAEAATAFERVLALAPNHAEALTELGTVLARRNRVREAIPRFRKAIELRPALAKAHNNLGVALTQLGQTDEGFACHQEAARLQPNYADAHFYLALALASRKRTAEAIAAYERALQARPNNADVLFNLGLLLVNEQRAADAVVCLEQAVRLKPNYAEGHNNLGLAYAEVGRFDESVASCGEALRLRPLDPKAHMNRGNALSALGRIDEALACYDFALRLQPDYINGRWNRALALLADGDFERGWAAYESRWQRPETKTRQVPRPRWDGGPLEGKTIFLWCEQGIGDTLQFVRYASLLKQRGAVVWQECPAHLVPLLSTCPGIDRVFAERTPVPLEFDCHAPLMSLPLGCGTTLATVPAATPYLFADAAQVERWRGELGDGSCLKIGITWQGNPRHRWDRQRSFSVQWFRSLALQGGRLRTAERQADPGGGGGRGLRRPDRVPAAGAGHLDFRPDRTDSPRRGVAACATPRPSSEEGGHVRLAQVICPGGKAQDALQAHRQNRESDPPRAMQATNLRRIRCTRVSKTGKVALGVQCKQRIRRRFVSCAWPKTEK